MMITNSNAAPGASAAGAAAAAGAAGAAAGERAAAAKLLFFWPCCWSLFFLTAMAISSPGSSAEDAQALLDLKESMGSPQQLSSWQPGSDPCSGWWGVNCDKSRVVTLQLNQTSASSINTSHIARLTQLTHLQLEQNNFTGVLSPEITTLRHLRFVNISHNVFNGTFPADLSGMVSLETLDAYNNNFTGQLPGGVTGLHHLEHLHLGGSYFSGSIPSEYGNITSLRYLGLSGNDLSGRIPRELGNLVKLQQLYLGYYNDYNSEIPSELGNLRSLVRLDLSECNLVGSIPPELGNLSNLDSLFLQINKLAGPIPEQLGKLSQLRSLDLSSNQFTGEIPANFNGLEKLELLNLFRNSLPGSIPSFIGDLPNLQVLQLWQNDFSGEIPSLLGTSGSLKMLDLSSNNLTGSIPPNLCKGQQLTVLILRSNQLTGDIPDSLGECTTLEKVRLGENLLQGGVPRGFFSLPRLNTLELLQNRLDGTLEAAGGDPVIFSASNLTTIDLSENLLKGSIPSGLWQLRELRKLSLGWNRITGPLPAELGNLTQLIFLNVSHNQLYGTVPDTIGRCKTLIFLDAGSNSLRGSIPASLFKLPVLGVVNLSHNFLDGTIPSSLASSKINTIDLSFNRLEGEIPRGEDQLFNASSNFEGNAGLCGSPLRACPRHQVPRKSGNRHNDGDSLLAWLVGALFAAAFIVLVLGVCCFIRKYRYYVCGLLRISSKNKRHHLPCLCGTSSYCCCSWWRQLMGSSNLSGLWRLTAFQKLDFTASQVLDCMVEDNIIGRGGSGVVYRGVMPSGEVVAVKRLNSTFATRSNKGGSSHADHGFSAEVQTLGKIRHRNIVKLLGCCSNKETNVLVYEYMPNGSLGEALHSKKGPVLDWATRYKVALQAANGLCYLHHDCSPLIVHRDVKSNNILLDGNFQAHVADFGLAKLFQDSGKSESMSSIAGSYGYIAPEYAYTLKVNEKSDIYSFGVVLLELVTGRRPIEPEYGDGVDVVQWVRKKIQSKDGMLEVLDSRIADDTSRKLPLQEVMLLLRVALLCTNDLPVDRPTMRDVVQMLADVRMPLNKTSSNREDSSSSAEEDFFGDLSSSQLISPSLKV